MAIEFYVPEIREGEEVKTFSRKHIMFLLTPLSTIATLFVLPLVGVFIFYDLASFLTVSPVKNFVILIMSTYLLLLCGTTLFIWFRYYYSYLIVTDSRIIEIDQKSLFNRTTAELELLRIEDVKALVKGILATFLRYGDVLVETAGAEENNFLFEKIPEASYVSTQILELAQKSTGIHSPLLGGRAIDKTPEASLSQKTPSSHNEGVNSRPNSSTENVERNEENILYKKDNENN